MSEVDYKKTNYKVGKVKSLFEENGYGFISATNQDGFGDIFFHYKYLKSQVIKDKDLVVFLKIDSKRHVGKQEAINVIVLSDVIDFVKLFQLYLNYGFQEI